MSSRKRYTRNWSCSNKINYQSKSLCNSLTFYALTPVYPWKLPFICIEKIWTTISTFSFPSMNLPLLKHLMNGRKIQSLSAKHSTGCVLSVARSQLIIYHHMNTISQKLVCNLGKVPPWTLEWSKLLLDRRLETATTVGRKNTCLITANNYNTHKDVPPLTYSQAIPHSLHPISRTAKSCLLPLPPLSLSQPPTLQQQEHLSGKMKKHRHTTWICLKPRHNN